jgi:hypothetical protein
MKEKLRNLFDEMKVRSRYKSMNAIIDMIEPLIDQEVEKRIKERMPSEEDIELYASLLFPFEQPKSTNTHGDEFNRPKRFGFKNGVIWLRSRLTQKTEGGG